MSISLASMVLSVAAAMVPSQYEVETLADGSRAVRGELLVGLDPAQPTSDAALQALGLQVVERVPALGLLRLRLLEGADLEARRAALGALPGVLFAERNGVGQGGGLPVDDTFLGAEWQLENTGQSGGTPGADIDAPDAWLLQRGDPSVIVAVLDTGIDAGHPAFIGRLLRGTDTVNDDDDPDADHPHGIFVTGLLAANADDGHGIAGVDHRCTILPVKVLDANNNGTTMDLIQGLDFARQSGAHVVSMSLVGFSGTQALQNALAASRAAGQILVACGGNGGLGSADTSWPGASDDTLAIGWTDDNDARSNQSGSGLALDFMAPGVQVVTVAETHADDMSPFSGCSAATPIAAGIVSLLLAQDPTLDQDRLLELLRLSADDRVGGPADFPGRDNFYGHGRLDARGALDCLADCVGDAYCNVLGNSFSSAARLHAWGSAQVGDDDLTLHGRFLPPGGFGLFFTGTTAIEAPFGDGLRCVGGSLRRLFPPDQVDTQGDVARDLDLPALGVQSGTTTHFQLWFRDSGPSGFNTSDALRVEWQ